MTDENDLESILGELEPQKSDLKQTLATMDGEHFNKAVEAVNAEYLKRVDQTANVGAMSDGEYRDFIRRRFGYYPV